jgi:hypothetical protein
LDVDSFTNVPAIADQRKVAAGPHYAGFGRFGAKEVSIRAIFCTDSLDLFPTTGQRRPIRPQLTEFRILASRIMEGNLLIPSRLSW